MLDLAVPSLQLPVLRLQLTILRIQLAILHLQLMGQHRGVVAAPLPAPAAGDHVVGDPDLCPACGWRWPAADGSASDSHANSTVPHPARVSCFIRLHPRAAASSLALLLFDHVAPPP